MSRPSAPCVTTTCRSCACEAYYDLLPERGSHIEESLIDLRTSILVDPMRKDTCCRFSRAVATGRRCSRNHRTPRLTQLGKQFQGALERLNASRRFRDIVNSTTKSGGRGPAEPFASRWQHDERLGRSLASRRYSSMPDPARRPRRSVHAVTSGMVFTNRFTDHLSLSPSATKDENPGWQPRNHKLLRSVWTDAVHGLSALCDSSDHFILFAAPGDKELHSRNG